ncbi:cupin domain-containing protein [Pendulispora albinea]|uniref:Cupin domain-containing protein n=1 Tax=Pendulispora albinea TaxID=2741071 RepID=A0ABZ2LY94_9BACT
MDIHDTLALAAGLPTLDLAVVRDEAEALSAMRILGKFNQCMPGLTRFCGESPWERHPDDELLFVLEGSVQLIVQRTDRMLDIHNLAKGNVCVVPPRLWHKQIAHVPVTLFFVTSAHGNKTSDAVRPV